MEWSNLDTVLTLVSIAGGLYFAVVVIGDSLRALWRSWFPVKDYDDGPRFAMSRDDDGDDRELPVVPRTDDARTPDGRPAGPQVVTYDRAQLLTLYTYLRALGAKRDDARPVLKALNIPLSNDVWSAAAPPPPPDDDATVTPIAGRRTNAVFYPDQPDLEYQPPPRHR